MKTSTNPKPSASTWLEIFLTSSKLGLTSFGGPVAHLAYFHEAYVRRKKWMDEKCYADLVALCQFLPGPTSSQVGIGVGIMRGGIVGGLISFLGFTMPSAIVLLAFALLLQGVDVAGAGWIQGLKLVAVAVVAHAILGMGKNLTPDAPRQGIALGAMIIVLLLQNVLTQVGVILFAGVLGLFIFKETVPHKETLVRFPVKRSWAYLSITVFFSLLFFLPIVAEVTGSSWVSLFDSFYRVGSLVFGGGHVVLPLLEREFVPTGLLSKETFLAGYGATQAVPGPLFTFSAYLGGAMKGIAGGVVGIAAVFLPSFLLLLGILPFWDDLRENPRVKGALTGVNAAVVGILLSAFYDPIWTSAVKSSADFTIAATLFSLLAFFRAPAWGIVILGALGGMILL